MENEELTLKKRKAVKLVNIVNGIIAALMLISCLFPNEATGILAFLLGAAVAIVNLVFLIIFASRGWNAYVFCIIWMLVLPIIGFGCCALGLSEMSYH